MSRVATEGGWPGAEKGQRSILRVGLLFLMIAFGPTATVASAAEIVFLQDGRAIRAEKTEIVGDTVRIEQPAGTIELPRSAVLSVHAVTPPAASPSTPPPAELYRDMSQQMTDKVRREIPEPGASRGKER